MDTTRPTSQKQFHPSRHFTDECIQSILQDLREGCPKKYAAESNGISESHFYFAIKQGITDIHHDERDTKWAKLVESIRTIEKHEIKSCRQAILSSEKGHKGAEWTLEHVYWREFCADAKIMHLAQQLEQLQGETNETKS